MSTKNETDNKFTVKLWSNMWTHQITKIEADGSDQGTTVDFLFIPKFNQTVIVKAPDESMSLSQLQSYIQELFTSLNSGNPQV